MPPSTTSDNFRIARVAAILVVVLVHLGLGYNLWIPAAIALFVFGFSSAFFTAEKYDAAFQLGAFWRRKLYRLGPHLLVINVFLLVLFVVELQPGIVTWQTPLNMLGLTGLLNWFSVPVNSPFGAGLWFFTLLLIFYVLYPGLRLLSRSGWALGSLVCASLLFFAVLDRRVPMGHALWLSAWSFLFGLAAHRFRLSPPATVSALLAAGFTVALLGLNLAFRFNQLNFFLIVGVSAALVLWVKESRFPLKVLLPLDILSGCVLEIYFIHSYLVIKGNGPMALNVAMSLTSILYASWVLSKTADWIRRLAVLPIVVILSEAKDL